MSISLSISLYNDNILNDEGYNDNTKTILKDMNQFESNGPPSSIQMIKTNEPISPLSSELKDFFNCDNNYSCDKCSKIPKIVFIDHNEIELDCCKDYYYKKIKIKDYLEIIEKNNKEKNLKIESKKLLNYCLPCQSNNKCRECIKKEKILNFNNKIEEFIKPYIEKEKKNSRCLKKTKDTIIKANKDYSFIQPDIISESSNYNAIPIIIENNKSFENKEYMTDYIMLINIIKNNFQFYNNINHFNNLKNILNYLKNRNQILNKNHFILEYKGQFNEKIRILGSKFVENNKDKCFLVINNKIKELIGENLIYQRNGILRIILVEKKLIDDMSHLFEKCDKLLNTSNMSKWNTSQVKKMNQMFCQCKYIKELPDISNWNTQNVSDMNNLFKKCSSLEILPNISKWDIKNVKNISGIFSECSSLKGFPEISKWDTNNITNMSKAFNKCQNIETLPDISQWKTPKVQTFSKMFNKCKSLKFFPDISKWNLSNAEDIYKMFNKCSKLEDLPCLSNWDISKVAKLDKVFDGCISLKNEPKIINKKIIYMNNHQKMNENKFSKDILYFSICQDLK